MNVITIEEFRTKYDELFENEYILFRDNILTLSELKKIVSFLLVNKIKEKDVFDLAWNIISDDNYSYEEENLNILADVLFTIDEMSECRDDNCKQRLLELIKTKLDIN